MLASIYNFKARPLLGPIEVNVSSRETYSLSASMPAHAVERGADITDHRKILPESFSIEGWISGASIRSQVRIDDEGNVIREPINGEGIVGLSISEAYEQIQEVFKQKEPFDVVTNFRSYSNMHFTSMVITRDDVTSEVIAFSATMVEIQFADSQTDTIRVTRSPAASAPKTAAKKKVGKKETKPLNQSTADKIGHKLAPGFLKDPAGKLNAFLDALPAVNPF